MGGRNAAPADEGSAGGSLFRPVVMLVILVAGAVALRKVPFFHTILSDTALLRQGVAGRGWFVFAGSLWCLFGLPRQVPCFIAGLAYGLPEGTALASLCTVIGAVGCFSWARWGGRDWGERMLAQRAENPGFLIRHLGRVSAMLKRHPFETIVTLRLLPVGSSLLLNLFAGMAGVAFLPFVGATLIGSLPQTVIFVTLGSGVQFGGPWRTVVAVILFVASAWLGYRLLRRVTVE